MKIACWIVVISYSNLSAQLLLVRLEVLIFFVKITFGIKIYTSSSLFFLKT